MAASNPPSGQTPPTGDDTPVAFTRPAAKRVADATKYVETMIKQHAPGFASVRGNGGTIPADAKGDIPSGTRANPGKGTATVYGLLDNDTTASMEQDVTVYSINDKVIKSGAGILISSNGGPWWVVNVDSCNNLGSPSTGAEMDFPPLPSRLTDGSADNAPHALKPGAGFEDFIEPPYIPASGTNTPSLVQSAVATGNSNSPACSFSGATTSGNLIIVKIAYIAAGGSFTLASYTQDVANTSLNPSIILSRSNAPATTTLTGSLTSSTRWIMSVEEWANLKTSGAKDQTATATTSTGSSGSSGTTGATTQAKEMAAVVIGVDDGTAGDGLFSAPTNGFTLLANKANGNPLAMATLYKVLSSTGAQSTAVNCSTNPNYYGAIATYRST